MGINENVALKTLVQTIRRRIESIVCTQGEDAGVVLLSQEGATRTEIVDGRPVQVYEHQYFSPLGDALMELYALTEGQPLSSPHQLTQESTHQLP